MCIPGEKQTYDPDISSDLKLLQAAWAGEINVVKKLNAVGADIHGRCDFTHSDVPLFAAVENGHTGVLKSMLDRRADVHARVCIGSASPLTRASLNSHVNIVTSRY